RPFLFYHPRLFGRRRHHRQVDEASAGGAVKDLDRRFLVIAGFGEKDIVHVGLRVSVIQGKPARLHLHHNAVSRQEHMIGGRQREAENLLLIGRDRFWVGEGLRVEAMRLAMGSPLIFNGSVSTGVEKLNTSVREATSRGSLTSQVCHLAPSSSPMWMGRGI